MGPVGNQKVQFEAFWNKCEKLSPWGDRKNIHRVDRNELNEHF